MMKNRFMVRRRMIMMRSRFIIMRDRKEVYA